MKYFLIGLGGAAGSILRYVISSLQIEAGGFPIKTLVINVAGSFLISLAAVLAERHGGIPENVILMIRVGVCGGFTTFSTFAFETAGLMRAGQIGYGFWYVLLSVVLSVAAVFEAQVMFR